MKKNIAICIRGHMRTWNKCKHHIFKTFQELEHQANVHWFVITWDKQQDLKYKFNKFTSKIEMVQNRSYDFNEVKTHSDFEGHTLAQIRTMPFDKERLPAESFAKLCVFASETIDDYIFHFKVNFDAVVMIRPDVIYHSHDNLFIETLTTDILNCDQYWAINFSLKQFESSSFSQLHSTLPCVVNNKFPCPAADSWSFQDVLYYGNPGIISLLHDAYYKNKVRYAKFNSFFPHGSLGVQCSKYGLPVCRIDFNTVIVRDVSSDNFDFLRDIDVNLLHDDDEYFQLTTTLWYR